ncbi:MAG: type II secretion system inner membrane protein GspF [Legionellales bacterium]|jgi:general secretion pathway protein F
MAAFEYTALNAAGKKVSGVLQADSAKQIRSQLRDQNLSPLSVEKIEHKQKIEFFSRTPRYKLSSEELNLFTRQLATLIAARLPIAESLQSIAEQSEKPRIQKVVGAIRAGVMEGQSLAQALARFPKIFSELYRSTVGAGEAAGHLPEVLTRLADYLENQEKSMRKLWGALLYPAFIVIVSLLFVVILLVYVVPQVIEVFTETGQALPFLTRALIFLSNGLQHYGLWILIVLAIGLIIFLRGLKNYAFKTRVHELLLRLPLIGRVLRVANTARYARTLSILSDAGVSILDALTAAQRVVTLIPMQEAMSHVVTQVREGMSLNKALKQTGFMPAMSIHLIASGEATGQLEEMLLRSANIQDSEVDRLVSGSLTIFEPLMILFMGVVVLLIVLAILLPIFEVTQIVGS